MPIGETVISSPVIPLSVKAVRGIQAERDVIGLLKVVFYRMSQNATSSEAVCVVEPLDKQAPAYLSQNATVSQNATTLLL